MSSTALPAQSIDFPAWYGEVARRAELAESSTVRGAMVIRPYGYAIWEAIQRALDERIKATGHENLYFPLFVPASVLAHEGELVEGFAPEVAVVTEAGGRHLDEPLAVRPTSEALIWSTYARSDGKALQVATAHYLGQAFGRTFGVHYTGRDGADHHPYATSWGASTRLVGGVVMAHGDDRGLRLPPRVAPHQVVIVPIVGDKDRAAVLQTAAAIAEELRAASVRVRLDDRDEHRPGFKFNEWELKGGPSGSRSARATSPPARSRSPAATAARRSRSRSRRSRRRSSGCWRRSTRRSTGRRSTSGSGERSGARRATER